MSPFLTAVISPRVMLSTPRSSPASLGPKAAEEAVPAIQANNICHVSDFLCHCLPAKLGLGLLSSLFVQPWHKGDEVHSIRALLTQFFKVMSSTTTHSGERGESQKVQQCQTLSSFSEGRKKACVHVSMDPKWMSCALAPVGCTTLKAHLLAEQNLQHLLSSPQCS